MAPTNPFEATNFMNEGDGEQTGIDISCSQLETEHSNIALEAIRVQLTMILVLHSMDWTFNTVGNGSPSQILHEIGSLLSTVRKTKLGNAIFPIVELKLFEGMKNLPNWNKFETLKITFDEFIHCLIIVIFNRYSFDLSFNENQSFRDELPDIAFDSRMQWCTHPLTSGASGERARELGQLFKEIIPLSPATINNIDIGLSGFLGLANSCNDQLFANEIHAGITRHGALMSLVLSFLAADSPNCELVAEPLWRRAKEMFQSILHQTRTKLANAKSLGKKISFNEDSFIAFSDFVAILLAKGKDSIPNSTFQGRLREFIEFLKEVKEIANSHDCEFKSSKFLRVFLETSRIDCDDKEFFERVVKNLGLFFDKITIDPFEEFAEYESDLVYEIEPNDFEEKECEEALEEDAEPIVENDLIYVPPIYE